MEYPQSDSMPCQKSGNQAWDRLPDESSEAWAAFQAYRNLGRKRSIPKCIRALGLSFSMSLQRQYERWSHDHLWRERVAAWDEYLDSEVQEAMRQRAIAAAEAHYAVAGEMVALVKRVLEAKFGAALAEDDPELLIQRLVAVSNGDLARLLDTAVKVQRLATGEATERVQQEVNEEVRHGFTDLTDALRDDAGASDLASELFHRLVESARSGGGRPAVAQDDCEG